MVAPPHMLPSSAPCDTPSAPDRLRKSSRLHLTDATPSKRAKPFKRPPKAALNLKRRV